MYGLGTVPSEPRQWLWGAWGHVRVIFRSVSLLELEVASSTFAVRFPAGRRGADQSPERVTLLHVGLSWVEGERAKICRKTVNIVAIRY